MLSRKELAEIKGLQEICEKEGGFHLKLNDEMLENRNKGFQEDFFHYEDGQLVGFLGIYDFGNKVELCGMVHPEYRRRGIFTKLMELALSEAKNRDTETILLNTPTTSQSGKEFIKNLPCKFAVAEYQMKWEKQELEVDPAIILRPSVSEEDWSAEVQLEVQCFGFSEKEASDFNKEIRENSNDLCLIIEMDGIIRGKMRVSESNGEAWIYGFAVFPAYQGRGIGRKALTNVVRMENLKGLSVFLEVEAENAHALKLYESCGFKSYHSQDYYHYIG